METLPNRRITNIVDIPRSMLPLGCLDSVACGVMFNEFLPVNIPEGKFRSRFEIPIATDAS